MNRLNYSKILEIIISCIFCAVMMTACVANPGQEIITSKNDGAFNAGIVSTDTEDSPPDATQHVKYNEVFSSKDGSVEFILNIDETVTAANMPVVEVSPHHITENDAERVAAALFGDVDFYEAEPLMDQKYSKSEILEKITRWSQFTSNEAVIELLGQSSESTVEVVKSFIEEYTVMLESAPEENPHELCRWQFKKALYYTLSKDEADAMDTSNDNDEIKALLDIGDISYLYYVSTRNADDFKINNINVSLYDGISPASIDGYIFRAQLCRTEEPTDEQVAAVQHNAEEMLRMMDLGDWIINSCSVSTIYYGETPEYTVRINATPVLNGVAAVWQEQLNNLRSKEAYASNYYLTEANFEFSANGDLVSFEMYSPIDIQAVVNDNVQVLNFYDLIHRAKAYLELSDYYAYGIDLFGDSINEEMGCTVEINELEYNLTRVKVPDTDDRYYYIPAVTLRGNVQYYGKQSGNTYYTSDKPVTLVVLNSVDGSIINSTNE